MKTLRIDEEYPGIQQSENGHFYIDNFLKYDGDIIISLPCDIDIWGDLIAGGSIVIDPDSELLCKGDIVAKGDLVACGSIVALGGIDVGGNIESNQDIFSYGSIRAGGGISAGGDLIAHRSITSGEFIDVGMGIMSGKHGGDLEAGMDIKVKGEMTVLGDIKIKGEEYTNWTTEEQPANVFSRIFGGGKLNGHIE